MPPKRAVSKKAVSKKGVPSTNRASKRQRGISVPHFPWPMRDEEMQATYARLVKRPIQVTRFIHEPTLATLGLIGPVATYMRNVGWEQFCHMSLPTYKELTLEFLSSLGVTYSKNGSTDEGNVTFRLMGVEYKLTMLQLNTFFGFHVDGITKLPLDFNTESAWSKLSSTSNYNPCSTKATTLTCPALRYVHKFLATSIFGRGDSTGVVAKQELFLLDTMIRGGRVATAYWMVEHMKRITRQTRGSIRVGGIISMIAAVLDVDLSAPVHTKVEGNMFLDWDTTVAMGIAVRREGQYVLVKDEVSDPAHTQAVEDQFDDAEDQATEEATHEVNPLEQEASAIPSSSTSAAVTMEMLLARLDFWGNESRKRIDAVSNDLQEFKQQTSLALASIGCKLDKYLNDDVE